jgi:hypothetical protein
VWTEIPQKSLSQKHSAKVKNLSKKDHLTVWLHSYEMSRIGTSQIEKWVTGCTICQGRTVVAEGYEASFVDDENVLKSTVALVCDFTKAIKLYPLSRRIVQYVNLHPNKAINNSAYANSLKPLTKMSA